MIRSKKFFTTGSIVSMAIMFVTLMLGFIEDNYNYSSRYYYSYYTSFADDYYEVYWLFFALTIAYIAFGIVAIALYNKRIKAINIVNLVSTSVTYMFAMIVFFVAADNGNVVFPLFLLLAALGVACQFHLLVDIFALIAQRYKVAENQPSTVPQEPIFETQDAIEMLKQIKDLHEAGLLTEEEYNAKRQQYASKI